MPAKENKALVGRCYEELFNKHNIAAADEFMDPAFVYHRPNGTDAYGPDGWRAHFGPFFAALPDYHVGIEDMIAEGDKVVIRFTMVGTFEGDLAGIPPTGKEVVSWGINIERIVGGKIVETWTRTDTLGGAQQMGMIPTPGARGG